VAAIELSQVQRNPPTLIVVAARFSCPAHDRQPVERIDLERSLRRPGWPHPARASQTKRWRASPGSSGLSATGRSPPDSHQRSATDSPKSSDLFPNHHSPTASRWPSRNSPDESGSSPPKRAPRWPWRDGASPAKRHPTLPCHDPTGVPPPPARSSPDHNPDDFKRGGAASTALLGSRSRLRWAIPT